MAAHRRAPRPDPITNALLYERFKRGALALGYDEEQARQAWMEWAHGKIRAQMAERRAMLQRKNARTYAQTLKGVATRRRTFGGGYGPSTVRWREQRDHRGRFLPLGNRPPRLNAAATAPSPLFDGDRLQRLLDELKAAAAAPSVDLLQRFLAGG